MPLLHRRKPEVMSPAGHWPQLRAAIEAGADAVYFGLQHFSARAKVGFTLAELPEVMRTLHTRGVKGYLTFNTLVFEHELREAARLLAEIARAGADSIIVQDLGIAKLARDIAPDLAVHGSTQMSITSAEGVELARSLGVSRVVLARELSLKEIRAIREATEVELEMFVHGALCVSYSGQCFSSEAWGGRSANRGQCAQACRLSYDMIVDGRRQPLGDARYLLSPGDLYALREVPEIVEIGISSLKIEGRYKDADYVALTTAAYREAVDAAWQKREAAISAADELRLEQAYSRGFGPYFVTGTDHQAVVKGRAPRHRGVQVGEVVEVLRNGVRLRPAKSVEEIAPLKAGDGLVFDAADWRSPDEKEEGGRVFAVKRLKNGSIEIEFGNDAVDLSRIRAGDLIWRTHDPELDRAVKPLIEALRRKQPVSVEVCAHAGKPLETTWRAGNVEVQLASASALEPAQNQGLTVAKLQEQFERLGNTPYELGELQADIQGNPFAPASLLNQIRRDAAEQLEALQASPPVRQIRTVEIPVGVSSPRIPRQSPSIHLLVRTADQLEAAIEQRPASITLDYLELYGLQPSVARIKEHGIAARVASPRVLKPNEQRIVHFLRKLDCAILVRSGGLLHALRQEPENCPPLIGDFSLNAANAISAGILSELGLTRFTPTYDLNADQIARLARDIGSELVEAVVYQHLPVFHTEHCVFCRFLSEGTSYLDCGHPCEKHRVALRDQQGREHPVMADVGCRNTVFGAEAQEASLHLDRWRDAGIHQFRLEFVHETPEQVGKVAAAFCDAIEGRISARELQQRWKRISPQGTAEGSLFVPPNYMTLPILQ
jgi:U32 family peptidase